MQVERADILLWFLIVEGEHSVSLSGDFLVNTLYQVEEVPFYF